MITLPYLFLALLPLSGRAPTDTVRANIIAVIGENSPRTPFLLGEVSGLAIDAVGRVYVSDFQDPRIVVFAPDGRKLTIIGRKGKGPGEFTAPTGPVFGADGALYIRDLEKVSRFSADPKSGLPTRFDRFFEGPPMAPWRSKLASSIDNAGRFHFPLEVGLRDGITHYSYQRYALDGRKLDSIAVPVQLTARSNWASVPIAPGTGRMVKGVNVVPFHPMPVWAVGSTGNIIAGPGDRYTLSETNAIGQAVRQFGRNIALDRIPQAERAESTRALKRRIDSLPVPLAQVNGVSEEVRAMRLPETYPSYRSASVAANGELWIRRSSTASARKSSFFDLFGAAGVYLRTVVVPVDCSIAPAPVIRGSSFACLAIDEESGAETVVLATTGG
ncbi:MAG: 6-bladed beta-propeller [Gemmatimonadales bacterium]